MFVRLLECVCVWSECGQCKKEVQCSWGDVRWCTVAQSCAILYFLKVKDYIVVQLYSGFFPMYYIIENLNIFLI